jgi:Tol biopolymer transport system component
VAARLTRLCAPLAGHVGARLAVGAVAVVCVLAAAGPAPTPARAGSPLAQLTSAGPGSNEVAPRWSPSGRWLTLERDDGASRTVEVYALDLEPRARHAETLAVRPAAAGAGFLLETAGVQGPTFNAWVTWAPDERRFAFVSNGGAGSYDIWLGEVGPTGALVAPPVRLTQDAEADGQVAWSPAGDRLAFVSGRTDRGDLYLLDVATRQVTRLTRDGRSVLHPEWSPDGRRIAFASGDGENHDICVLEVGKATSARRCVVSWPFDDLRPRWSPSGQRLAFYSSYNADGEAAVWSLFTIAADGSEPARGDGLLASRLDTGVVVDLDVGPAWTPQGDALVYAKRVDRDFNPLHVAYLGSPGSRRLDTGHAIHHDVAIARDGRLAVRAQLARWDRVLVGRLADLLPRPDTAAGRSTETSR